VSALPILIAGAGIGGVAAALALARNGQPVVVLERAEAAAEIGAGIQLSPNACAALLSLGVLEEVRGKSFEPEAIEMRDGISGALLAREPAGAQFEGYFGSPYLQIRRADLHEIMLDAALAAGVSIWNGSHVTSFETVASEVRIALSSGESVSGCALIGADGLRSAVREGLFGPEKARFTGQIAYRALIAREDVDAATFAPVAGVWLGARQHFVHYFVAGGAAINVVGVVEGAEPGLESWEREAPDEALKAAFKDWAPPVRQLCIAARATRCWPLFDRLPLASWGRDNVTLLGDACHPMLPFLAQGAAMALEDAVTLAHCVEDSGDNFRQGFRRYETLRKPRTARVQAAARRNARLFHLPMTMMRQGLGAVLSLGSIVAPGKLSLRQDWLYGYRA
jgi:salicylate hydroxylase